MVVYFMSSCFLLGVLTIIATLYSIGSMIDELGHCTEFEWRGSHLSKHRQIAENSILAKVIHDICVKDYITWVFHVKDLVRADEIQNI